MHIYEIVVFWSSNSQLLIDVSKRSSNPSPLWSTDNMWKELLKPLILNSLFPH